MPKIVQKHRGTRFSHCSCHCKTVTHSKLTVSKGGVAYRYVNWPMLKWLATSILPVNGAKSHIAFQMCSQF